MMIRKATVKYSLIVSVSILFLGVMFYFVQPAFSGDEGPFTISERTEYGIIENTVYLTFTDTSDKAQYIDNITFTFMDSDRTRTVTIKDFLLNQSVVIDDYGYVNKSIGKYETSKNITIGEGENSTWYMKYYDNDENEMSCVYVLLDKSCMVGIYKVIENHIEYQFLDTPNTKEKIVTNGLKIEQKVSGSVPLTKLGNAEIKITMPHILFFNLDIPYNENKYNITACSQYGCSELDPTWWNSSFKYNASISSNQIANRNESITFFMSNISGWARTQVLSNCNDIRIVNASNNEQLDYFVDICNSTNIRVGFLNKYNVSGVIANVYWNSSTAEAQNKSMRMFYDDFNDNSIDLNNWAWTVGCVNTNRVIEENGVLNATYGLVAQCALIWKGNTTALQYESVMNKLWYNYDYDYNYAGGAGMFINASLYNGHYLARAYQDATKIEIEHDNQDRGDFKIAANMQPNTWFWMYMKTNATAYIGSKWNVTNENSTQNKTVWATDNIPGKEYRGLAIPSDATVGRYVLFDDFQVWAQTYTPSWYSTASTITLGAATMGEVAPTYTDFGATITNNTGISIGQSITYYAKWNDDTTLDKCMNSSKINTTTGIGNWWNSSFIARANISSNQVANRNESITFYMSNISGWSRNQVLSNCNDIRVLNSSGNEQLDYFIDICNSTDIRIGFLNKYNVSGTIATIYWNYSTAEAQNKSMRLFYDDFNDNSVNWNNWNFTQGCTTPGTTITEQNGVLNHTTSTGGQCSLVWYSNASILQYETVMAKVKYSSTSNYLYLGIGAFQNTTTYNGIHLAQAYTHVESIEIEHDNADRGDGYVNASLTNNVWFWFMQSNDASKTRGYTWKADTENSIQNIKCLSSDVGYKYRFGIEWTGNPANSYVIYDDFQVWAAGYDPTFYATSSTLTITTKEDYGGTSSSWVNGTWASAGTGNWTNYTVKFPAEVGSNYTVKIYCNDTSGNMNVTGTLFWWNAISPIVTIFSPTNSTYVKGDIWSNITLDKAGSWCGASFDGGSNVTMTNSTGNWNYKNTTVDIGTHNVRFWCNDTNNNWNASANNIVYYTIDNAVPTYTNFGSSIVNNTAVNTLISDNYYNLSINDTFSGNSIDTTQWKVYNTTLFTSETGRLYQYGTVTLIADSTYLTSITGNYSDFTMSVTYNQISGSGTVFWYDTRSGFLFRANNYSYTGQHIFAGSGYEVSVARRDVNHAGASIISILRYNNNGLYTELNYSAITITQATNYTLNVTVLGNNITVYWNGNFIANATDNTYNAGNISIMEVLGDGGGVGTINNSWSNFLLYSQSGQVNTLTYYAQWSDNIQLDKCMNSSKINTSGTWTNGTWASVSTGNWTNYTIAFPVEQGSNLTVKIYCNDTSGNMNVTGTLFWWNVTNIVTDSCTYPGSGTWSINCADNCVITANTNMNGNAITFYGTGNAYLNANIVNISQRTFVPNCPVVIGTGKLFG